MRQKQINKFQRSKRKEMNESLFESKEFEPDKLEGQLIRIEFLQKNRGKERYLLKKTIRNECMQLVLVRRMPKIGDLKNFTCPRRILVLIYTTSLFLFLDSLL